MSSDVPSPKLCPGIRVDNEVRISPAISKVARNVPEIKGILTSRVTTFDAMVVVQPLVADPVVKAFRASDHDATRTDDVISGSVASSVDVVHLSPTPLVAPNVAWEPAVSTRVDALSNNNPF